MRITVLAIGTRMPAWVNDGVSTYQKRLPRHIELTFKELPAAQRGGNSSSEKQKQKEGEQMLKALRDPVYTIALDERGESWSSPELAQQLELWLANHANVALLIGGADGLAESCRQRADHIWSLSSLTLPHALVRVVVAEQLYRAWTLLQGHPYHRD
jgi:23S rRNA (pseudouridine1915-N3)-methyltransferase